MIPKDLLLMPGRLHVFRSRRGWFSLGAVFVAALVLLVSACQGGSPSNPFGTAAPDTTRAPQALAVDPTDGSLLKAGGGVFRSTDQGHTWSALPIPSSLQPTSLLQVATTSAAPDTLFAAGSGAGVIRSDDRGQTWSAINSDLPSTAIAAFAVHSFHPGTLYAYIEGQGVFRTDDGGDNWQLMDAGPQARVLGLAHSTLPGSMNTGWLYAATGDGPYISMDCF